MDLVQPQLKPPNVCGLCIFTVPIFAYIMKLMNGGLSKSFKQMWMLDFAQTPPPPCGLNPSKKKLKSLTPYIGNYSSNGVGHTTS